MIRKGKGRKEKKITKKRRIKMGTENDCFLKREKERNNKKTEKKRKNTSTCLFLVFLHFFYDCVFFCFFLLFFIFYCLPHKKERRSLESQSFIIN